MLDQSGPLPEFLEKTGKRETKLKCASLKLPMPCCPQCENNYSSLWFQFWRFNELP
jgi:hypothetical protein